MNIIIESLYIETVILAHCPAGQFPCGTAEESRSMKNNRTNICPATASSNNPPSQSTLFHFVQLRNHKFGTDFDYDLNCPRLVHILIGV